MKPAIHSIYWCDRKYRSSHRRHPWSWSVAWKACVMASPRRQQPCSALWCRLTESVWAVVFLMISNNKGPNGLQCIHSCQTHLTVQSIQSDWSHNSSMRLWLKEEAVKGCCCPYLFILISLSLPLSPWLISFFPAIQLFHSSIRKERLLIVSSWDDLRFHFPYYTKENSCNNIS